MIIGTSARTRPRRRWALRIGRVALLTAFAAVGFAGPAAAHDVLLSSDPADGSAVQIAPAAITLTFDQPVQDFEPVVTVTGPDGQTYQSGSPTVDSTVVTNAVGPLSVAGEYVVAYRVVSADGHPVVGEVKFQFTGAPAPAPSPTTSAAAGSPTAASSATPRSSSAAAPTSLSTSAPVSTAAVAPTSSSSGLSGWVWAALALAAVLIIAAVVVVLRRPRQSG